MKGVASILFVEGVRLGWGMGEILIFTIDQGMNGPHLGPVSLRVMIDRKFDLSCNSPNEIKLKINCNFMKQGLG